MLFIDLAIALGIALFIAVLVGVVGGRSLGARLEARRRRLLGERNAAEERRRLDEQCVVCGEPVDPAVDLFERNQWWHRRCWRQSLE